MASKHSQYRTLQTHGTHCRASPASALHPGGCCARICCSWSLQRGHYTVEACWPWQLWWEGEYVKCEHVNFIWVWLCNEGWKNCCLLFEYIYIKYFIYIYICVYMYICKMKCLDGQYLYSCFVSYYYVDCGHPSYCLAKRKSFLQCQYSGCRNFDRT